MNTIYTWGHTGGGTVEDIRAYLDKFDAILVDVRYSPASQNYTMRQDYLREKLGANYVWIKEFGNVNYKNGGPISLADPAQGLVSLNFHLDGFKPDEKSVMLMCACRNWETCHRRIVACFIQQEGEGTPGEHLPTKFADYERRQKELERLRKGWG